ncbi:Acyl-coenzyme A:6-aminopenicillanic-acid-acyltransferase 40 kDa form (Isopenicillin-N N-acyltransferase) [Contains: Acyl-coenzyme A:6-aminopenicillanic-acid-acyltransferase 11 kDa subunit; Acyl-coenzyme A:6-aminopenicillanic-acid-acyltransferase 29 kDa subunit] [plant metagenome]
MAKRAIPLSVVSNLPSSRHLRLSGSHFELGLRHGLAHREAIQRFLADRRTRLDAVAPAAQLADLSGRIAAHAECIEWALPGMAQEVRGLAHGAGITLEEGYLLQLRREIAGYQAVPTAGDCTTFGRLAGACTVLGQTIDLNGGMAPELSVLEITHGATGRRLAMASFTGLLGYLGLNDRGLAVGLNLVLAGTWRPGIPAYMLIRHLLDEADSVDDCLAVLRAVPLASSRALMLTDGRRLVTVEYVLDDIRITEADASCHANHFLHPDFVPRDALNPFARTSSLRRQQACEDALRAVPAEAALERYFAFMDAAPVHVADTGDLRRECTVGTAVMQPRLGVLAVRQRAPVAATSSPVAARALLAV